MEHPGTLEEAIALIEQLRARVLQLEEENDLLALGNSRLLAELDEARTQARPAAKQAEQAAHGGLLPEDEHLLQEGDRGYVTDRKATLENAEATPEEIQNGVTKLGESSQKMGAAMYAAAEADQAAAGGTDTSTGASDDDVVDAEIVDEPADGADTGEGEAK